ncbi:glycerophosphoryl diester phosphodiesterase membrane domain-containing protein [Proteiniborus sp. MB09-C3]|uniref:glycerophosphoryl diester phosphodiesterase membrane domain-containing protein n=1 Tax=Proteiniborus sp. MB09-C3 TaxID=3050072 RepID=UPI00255695E0|nr:glycerophosphoryl diester phosphodiesterase membrane domain-containing protein [Proteiniborus sp. MB09-C3]WIV13087.1 glycerophosphoryl diester phosphodiesterase membrane domain-containing protein [Proteiniborus sp. MB09-C3]
MNDERYGAMTVTQMLDRSVYLHKKNIGASALYLFVMSILILVIGFIFSFIILLPFGVMTVLNNNTFELGFFISIFMFALIIAVLYYSLDAIRQSGIIAIGSNSFLGKKVDVSDAIMSAFKNILRVLSVVVAGGLMFSPVFLICGGAITSLLLNYKYGTWGLNAVIILISIIFIAAFIYFMTVHAFSVQIAIIEKAYFFKALKKSRKLVKGRFWKILGCFISATLSVLFINLSIYAVFALIGGIIYAVLGSSNLNDDLSAVLLMLGNIVRTPLQILVSLFVSPIIGIFMTILYYNMRFEKEGYDIELNISRLKNLQ